jgi:serine/threonine protein kinase
MVLGTPLYMSPEQARGEDELDARVDIYALGVIMYEATTGRVPFIGNNYLSVISQVLNEDPRPPRDFRADLSEEFEAVVMRAMAKDRDDRYPSAAALLNDVTALLEDPLHSTERAKITGPRRKAIRTRSPLKIAVWVALVAVVIAAVVTTVVALFGGSEAVKRKDNVVPPPVVLDAAPPPVETDAAPEVETLEVTILTEPTGATVQVDGIEKGTSPVTIPLFIDKHHTEVTASAPGYDDTSISFSTLLDKSRTHTIRLKKTAKAPPGGTPGRPPPRSRPPGGGTGEPRDKVPNKTGGELGVNPFKANTPPPKKP